MKILYARSHLSRKPAFRLLTTFVQTGGKISVIKSPVTAAAIPHVDSILEHEAEVKNYFGKTIKVLAAEKKQNALHYPFLAEPSLELLMERALINKDFEQLGELFKSGLDVIEHLPTEILNDHPDVESYRQWFGDEPDLSKQMLCLGVIDITAGNLISTQPKLTLLDCEWVLPFPVEQELVAFRYLWNLVNHFSSLFSMYPRELDALIVENTELVIPSEWLQTVLGTTDASKLNYYLKKEAYLQEYILDFQKQVVPTHVVLTPYEDAPGPDSLSLSPNQQPDVMRVHVNQVVKEHQETANARLQELTSQISEYKSEVANLQHQLFVIHHSKMWRGFYALKHPFSFAQKMRQRTRLLKIRAMSKLRRIRNTDQPVGPTVPVTDLSTLELHRNPISSFTAAASKIQVDIIVPVFNAGAEVRRCVESVLKYSPSTAHVYLIDDLSTDPELLKFYSELKHHPQVTVHRNPKRQGFVKNINTGFQLSADDVVILNTDTEVTPHWLEKLTTTAYSLPNVATVTPMTNNGEIMSIPKFVKPNLISDKFTLAEQNTFVEQFSAHQAIEVPTGVGFCMYIRRETIKTIGEFDAQTFGMGYGEENDFCQRAIQAGYVNIVDDSTFIYHRGTSSFTSEEKQQYIQNNLKILFDRFPTYEQQVHTFIQRNPLRYMQELFSLALNQTELFTEPAVLFIIHKNPFKVVGGVEVDVKRMLEQIGDFPLFFVLHRDDNTKENCLYLKVIKHGQIIHEFTYRFEQPFGFLDLDHQEITYFWQWLLKAFPNITTVHLEHIYALPIAGLHVFADAGKNVLLNFHDFYYVCPYEKLINSTVKEYVDLEKNTDACYNSMVETFGSLTAVDEYRQRRHKIVTDLFKTGVTKFIFNSQYTFEEHQRVWPSLFTKKNSTIIEPYA